MTALNVKVMLDSGRFENKIRTLIEGGAENPGALIGEMRRCREATIRAAGSAKSHGVIYHALQMVVVAIDGAAHVITGQPYYFSEGGTAPSESERARAARQGAFERGEGEL